MSPPLLQPDIDRLSVFSGFIHKCIQLYETTVVRHGLMLVGPTGSGKTKVYEVLQGACSLLQGVTSPAGTPFETTHTYILNPKSITMGQLYGEFDIMTHEWYVLAQRSLREFSSCTVSLLAQDAFENKTHLQRFGPISCTPSFDAQFWGNKVRRTHGTMRYAGKWCEDNHPMV